MDSTLRKLRRPTYQPRHHRVAYHSQAAALDRLMREAVLRIRDEVRNPLGIDRQAFSDVLRARPLGTRTIARLAISALEAGAPATALLRLSIALEGWLLSLEPDAGCFRQAAQEETREQGEADQAVLAAAFEPCATRPKVEEAIAQTMDHLAAQKRLLAALLARLQLLAHGDAS